MHKNPVFKYMTASSLFVYYTLLLQLRLFMSRTIVNHTVLFLIQGWLNENVIKEKKNESLHNGDEAFSEPTRQRNCTLNISYVQIKLQRKTKVG